MKLTSLFIVIIPLIILLTGCQSEDEQFSPTITELFVESTEPQAENAEGYPVAAEDINFGRFQIYWETDADSTQEFRFFIYVTQQKEIEYPHEFIATQLCNVKFNLCSPSKQTGCKIQNGVITCLSHSTRGVLLESLLGDEKQKILWFTLSVCPFEATATDEQCVTEARPFVLTQPCSTYRFSQCLDQEPLVVSNFKIKGITDSENGIPLVNNKGFQRVKFYPTWESSWLKEHYQFQIHIVDSRDHNNRITLLSSTCHERISCYPEGRVQCTFYPNESGASIDCLGNPERFKINLIDERHPSEDITVDFVLAVSDPLFQNEMEFNQSVKVKAFN